MATDEYKDMPYLPGQLESDYQKSFVPQPYSKVPVLKPDAIPVRSLNKMDVLSTYAAAYNMPKELNPPEPFNPEVKDVPPYSVYGTSMQPTTYADTIGRTLPQPPVASLKPQPGEGYRFECDPNGDDRFAAGRYLQSRQRALIYQQTHENAMEIESCKKIIAKAREPVPTGENKKKEIAKQSAALAATLGPRIRKSASVADTASTRPTTASSRQSGWTEFEVEGRRPHTSGELRKSASAPRLSATAPSAVEMARALRKPPAATFSSTARAAPRPPVPGVRLGARDPNELMRRAGPRAPRADTGAVHQEDRMDIMKRTMELRSQPNLRSLFGGRKETTREALDREALQRAQSLSPSKMSAQRTMRETDEAAERTDAAARAEAIARRAARAGARPATSYEPRRPPPGPAFAGRKPRRPASASRTAPAERPDEEPEGPPIDISWRPKSAGMTRQHSPFLKPGGPRGVYNKHQPAAKKEVLKQREVILPGSPEARAREKATLIKYPGSMLESFGPDRMSPGILKQVVNKVYYNVEPPQ